MIYLYRFFTRQERYFLYHLLNREGAGELIKCTQKGGVKRPVWLIDNERDFRAAINVLEAKANDTNSLTTHAKTRVQALKLLTKIKAININWEVQDGNQN